MSITGARWLPVSLPTTKDTRPLTMEELTEAVRRLPREKAPGPDAMPNEILKIILKEDPDSLLSLFYIC